MTVCNMSIEAGAKAGLIAPDDTTFEYLQGRQHAPYGRPLGRGASPTGARCTPTTARCGTSEVVLDAATITPHVTWGTNPGQVASIDAIDPVARPTSTDPTTQETVARALEYMGLEAGTRIRDVAVDTVFIGSCTNSRIEDLRAAAAVMEGRTVTVPRVMVVPGSHAVKAQADRRGARPGLHRRRRRLARAGLLDVPGDEPRQARARRTGGEHEQPQLRGPPGPRRAHPPRLPGRRRRHRGQGHVLHARRSPARTSTERRSRPDEGRPRHHRHRRAAQALRRRHRPDHPRRLAEAGRAHRLREGPVLHVEGRPQLRAQRRALRAGEHPRGRPGVRRRLVARARRVGDPAVRLQRRDRAELLRHLLQQLHEERPRAGRRSRRRPSRRSGRRSRPTPTTEIVVDMERLDRRGAGRRHRRVVPDRPRHAAPVPQRPRRRRHHDDPRRRDHRLRVHTAPPGSPEPATIHVCVKRFCVAGRANC